VQHAELGLEVVGLEEPGHGLALGHVAAPLASHLDLEDERLLREALGRALEVDHAHGCAEPLADEALEPRAEVVVHDAQTGSR